MPVKAILVTAYIMTRTKNTVAGLANIFENRYASSIVARPYTTKRMKIATAEDSKINQTIKQITIETYMLSSYPPL